jgi:hypothetical protein
VTTGLSKSSPAIIFLRLWRVIIDMIREQYQLIIQIITLHRH